VNECKETKIISTIIRVAKIEYLRKEPPKILGEQKLFAEKITTMGEPEKKVHF
jgi:hypothetical protein